MWIWRRPWKVSGILERTPRNPPAQGTWNGQKVIEGTGEALLGPDPAGIGSELVYNR